MPIILNVKLTQERPDLEAQIIFYSPSFIWCKITYDCKEDAFRGDMCACFIFWLYSWVWRKESSHDVGFQK